MSHLLATAQAASTRELARATSPDMRELVIELSLGLNYQKALSAPKIRDLSRTNDDKTVANMLVIILRASVESFRVKELPDALDLMQLAYDLVDKHRCESPEDLLLALKNARMKGTNTYNSLDISKLWGFFNDYLEEKSVFLENRHRDRKATAPGQDAAAVAIIAAAPQVATMLQRRLDPEHPNHDSLRRKLSITDACEKRGLITSEKAAEQRAQVEAANYRHATRRQEPWK